jgi:hypothetical protein
MDSDSKTNKINRKALGTSSLMIAISESFRDFILVYKLTQLTKDYWFTMFVLYVPIIFISSFISFKIGNKFWNILITFALFLNPLVMI